MPDANGCATVDRECPKCGESFPVSIGEFESHDNLKCPHCGVEFDSAALGQSEEFVEGALQD